MKATETKTPGAGPRILIVDDDAGQRSLLDSFLRSQGFDTALAASGEQALAVLDSDEGVRMMISDVRMPGMTGLETLRKARQSHVTLPVLLVTAYADIRDAVDAMRDGALNYLAKPIDLDELLATVRQAIGMVPVAPAFAADRRLPAGVVAESPLMQAVFRNAALIASSESRVLITGESGVGKEVLADVIHAWSGNYLGPIVKVNCAAIPEALLESELFGHEKGAFTGATAQRIGRFEEARNGTIFLDEIGDMSASLQAKLLRVTQDGRFSRVGSNRELQTNARILAATNRNLEEEVEAGRFREDLFYRLNVVELNIPSLRERPEDILPLATRFIAQFSGGKARFASTTTDCLTRYAWPGNVRELRNAMERAALLSMGELILPDHLPSRVRVAIKDESLPVSADAESLGDIERHAILHALKRHDYNRTETAKALGISRRALLYKLQRLRASGARVDP